jgi:putative molybdenum carrier protein
MARSRQNILSRNLRQLPYLQRTEWNVRDSDATVLFSLASELPGGSKKTIEFAKKHHKPWIHLAAGDQDVAQRLKDWLAQNPVDVLNVAGPRASKELGIASFVILYPRRRVRVLRTILGMTLGATRTRSLFSRIATTTGPQLPKYVPPEP